MNEATYDKLEIKLDGVKIVMEIDDLLSKALGGKLKKKVELTVKLKSFYFMYVLLLILTYLFVICSGLGAKMGRRRKVCGAEL